MKKWEKQAVSLLDKSLNPIHQELDELDWKYNFTKYFYKYKDLRRLEEIRKDILALEKETDGMIKEIIE